MICGLISRNFRKKHKGGLPLKSTEGQAVLLIYAFGALPWMGVNTPFVAGFLYTIIYAALRFMIMWDICSPAAFC